ncbi:hypothetical protein ARAM_005956 [Aspergillus rambellii]|uniref:Sexual development protein n=1 Tax=Aspergillus rambellii TaxID=308745 RepID=A0A0F8VPB6_9EURO|nr:hypothetical protein ARAM_005956 [Aspergillus rambellii]
MHFLPIFSLISTIPMSLAAPVTRGDASLPLPDGMPNPSPEQLRQIQLQAHGTLPGLPLPATISQAGITNLQLIAFNELFEVSFFNELLQNVTNEVDGYQLATEDDREFVIRSLTAILAQEEVHALTANTGLTHFGRNPIQPCRYTFPVTSLDAGINLAALFTNVVLGALQDITERFAANGDAGLTRVIAATIGNEGEQEGWFRVFQDKIPSQVPTLTTNDVNFAFTAIQNFVIPGTCPNIHEIDLRTFSPLEIITPPEARTQEIKLSWMHEKDDGQEIPMWLAYINQLNVPVVVPLHVLSIDGQQVTAVAEFPYDKYLMNGLTIAAVVNSGGPFADAAAVAKATLFGPGLINVN